MASKPRKVTQREIAYIAGVSQTTVSMVLNDRDGSNVRIPEATRARMRRCSSGRAQIRSTPALAPIISG